MPAVTLTSKLKNFRAAVTEWLAVERATLEQAEALQLSLLGGAIEGSQYTADRDKGSVDAHRTWVSTGIDWSGHGGVDTPEALDCGCLLNSLEKHGDARSTRYIKGQTAVVYVGATYIHLGDTPATNRWAKAAYDGIADYITSL